MAFWQPYTAKEIEPRGWLRRQLTVQARGLCGQLDKVWPSVRDSAWIGGHNDSWERVPYWLDGFVPLAFLLGNRSMQARAKKYIDGILSRQQESGWICPCPPEKIPAYDTWALLLLSKTLVVYYECSGDDRIPDALYRAMKDFYRRLQSGEVRLFDWGERRWFEGFVALRFLRERYREPWITDLGRLLKKQGTRWENEVEKWKRPLNRWTYETHVVNLAMMLKSEAISADFLGEPYTGLGERLLRVLEDYNGRPTGIFTGDECLSGLSPIQGTELCAVCELMYSYEWLYTATGDAAWADRLERAAFNALPAAFTDDMWAHQYVQMSNQIACEPFATPYGKSLFRTNNYEAHLFGLEPNCGCCTANGGQAWPKLALAAFRHSGNAIRAVVPLPMCLHAEEAEITLQTDYPFRNGFRYSVTAKKDFTFEIRVPAFAKGLKVNGAAVSADPATVSSDSAAVPADSPAVSSDSATTAGSAAAGRILSFALRAGETRVFRVSFRTEAKLEARPDGLHTLTCGSLVFSLPVAYRPEMREFTRGGVARVFPYCDYILHPESAWNYGFASRRFRVLRRTPGKIPFSSAEPPVSIFARMAPVEWDFEDGYDSVCAKLPAGRRAVGAVEEKILVPYGATRLRMTEMPIIRK